MDGQLDSVVGHAKKLGSELGKVARRTSTVAPKPGDRRFADAAWQRPLPKALVQAYLAACDELQAMIGELDLEGRSAARVRYVTGLILDALSPANGIFTNPVALDRAFRTRGKSLLRGLRNLVADLRKNGALPSMVDKRPFVVGENIAATPGEVVFRSEQLELIQYRPQTERVHARPIFIAPPQINRFYILDLSAKNSLVAHLVRQGFQVFMVSWRNPAPEHRDWGLSTYVEALEQAVDACRAITGSPDVNWMGVCAGGITSASTVSHFVARGRAKVNSLTLAVTLLDMAGLDETQLAALISTQNLSLAKKSSQLTGVLEGRDLARTFAWIRANDLIWNYWVSNYLLGNDPPAFDVLFWNADTTRLPARLHADFVEVLENDALVNEGTLQVLGHGVDLGKVEMDKYVVAGETDHITPWRGCYSSARLFGGNTEFVLCKSGHVQTLVCPPGNAKARYRAAALAGGSPDEWRRSAAEHAGSWWEHWTSWLAQRSGEMKPAPVELGGAGHAPLKPAPGTYVFE
jgi:polyhydroxyalkanoate synthase